MVPEVLHLSIPSADPTPDPYVTVCSGGLGGLVRRELIWMLAPRNHCRSAIDLSAAGYLVNDPVERVYRV